MLAKKRVRKLAKSALYKVGRRAWPRDALRDALKDALKDVQKDAKKVVLMDGSKARMRSE